MCGWVVAIGCAWSARSGYAEQVEFQLVGSNSLLAAPYIVDLANAPMQAQDVAGTSLTTTHSGTITVDVDNLLNPTTIAFISANAVAANSGSWRPEVGGGTVGLPEVEGDGDPGMPAPANYGFVIDVNLGSGPTKLFVASRDTAVSVDTDVAGALPITAGKFDPYGIGVKISQGTYDANLSSPEVGLGLGDEVTSSEDLTGEGGTNCSDDDDLSVNRCGSLMGSYAVSGNLITLTLPLDFLIGGGTPEVRFTGTFTATHSLAAPLLGDYNENGAVDAADYVVWRDNVGTTNDLPNDDIGGTIGVDHYNQWRANFGNPGSGVGSAAVPEPAALTLILLSLLSASFGFRRNIYRA
jgi:hypothetical protein